MLPVEATDPLVREILTRLTQHGFEAYVVGGAVRDILLDLPPKDYDLATAATPAQIKKVFGRRARIIGRRFRLAHVYDGQRYCEVSTFRRHPTPEERRAREEDDGVMIWRDNEFGTLETLTQNGWTLQYDRYGTALNTLLPQKIKISKGDLKVTLIIKEWLPLPAHEDTPPSPI